jgi:quercetin dioxygenase-like cupin family protein
VIVNPTSGERIVIRESGRHNGGELLAFDLFLPPGCHVPAGHVDPIQEEGFTIISGRMRFRLGRRTIAANPGETVRVAPGSAHWFGNDRAEVAHARVEVRPALRMEELLEATAALGEGGHIPLTAS